MTAKRAIWKFEVDSPEVTIDMPSGAYIVAVGQQAGGLVFWAEVDPHAEKRVPRRFRAVNTGTEYPAGCDWIGTVQFPNGLVWHLVEAYS